MFAIALYQVTINSGRVHWSGGLVAGGTASARAPLAWRGRMPSTTATRAGADATSRASASTRRLCEGAQARARDPAAPLRRRARPGADRALHALHARRSGRKPSYGQRKIAAIVSATLDSKPKGMTQWSCRRPAEAQGVSESTDHDIWQSHHLQPHRDKTFKRSRDAKFLEKLTDGVGLYLNPP